MLLALGFSFLIGGNDRPRRENLHAQQARIRPRVRRFDREFAVKELGLHFVPSHHSRRDQKLLPGLRIFGQQHGQDIVVVAAIENPSVREDRNHQAARTAKAQIQQNPRTLRGVPVDLLWNLTQRRNTRVPVQCSSFACPPPGPDTFFTVKVPQSESLNRDLPDAERRHGNAIRPRPA